MRNRDLTIVLFLIGIYASVAFLNMTEVNKQAIIITQQEERIKYLSNQNLNLTEKYNQVVQINNVLHKDIKALQSQLVRRLVGWKMQKGIATAYSPFDDENGINAQGDPGVTSRGLMPSTEVMAVDPNRIPYGSLIIVIYPDGAVIKGIAGDTGGALRSSATLHIDIFKKTYQEAITHGRKDVTIMWLPPN